jgi:hypothetical protein
MSRRLPTTGPGSYRVPDPENPDFIDVARPFLFPIALSDPYYVIEYDYGDGDVELEYLVFDGFLAGYAMFTSYIIMGDTLVERAVLGLYPSEGGGADEDVS